MTKTPLLFHRARLRRRQAFTLIELMFVMFLMTLLLMGGISLLQGSSRMFGGASGGAYAEINLARGVRIIESTLANAREYEIASDGQSITYYNNDASYPPKKDSTPHYFKRDPNKPTNLIWSDASVSRPTLTGVPISDPATGAPLLLFGPAGVRTKAGAVVTVRLVSQQTYYIGDAMRVTTRRALIHVAARNMERAQ